uniref:Transmembrane 4 L six family member 19 n=1 Tax=Aquila chrysaetos chrysaetos TaxID=223781 RepID=A0A663E9I9_AQUCH
AFTSPCPRILPLSWLPPAHSNILLLFPGGTSKYLVEGHISKQAKVMPGVWGGGITVSTAFISAVLSKLALLGAAACFVLSGVGLTDGPLCFYNASEHGRGHGILWDYPFLDNYLYDRHTWSTCLEPEGIVAWNVVLFSLLLLVSATEMVLASLQILNGCLGCLCGFCEGK